MGLKNRVWIFRSRLLGVLVMREEIYSSIKLLLQNDDTVTADHRLNILSVCRSPKKPQSGGICNPVEAAKILDCHIKTLYRYVKKGLLHTIHHSARKVRFDRAEVEHFAIHGIDKKDSGANAQIVPTVKTADSQSA